MPKYEGIVGFSDTEVVCKICDVYISRPSKTSVQNINTHIVGSQHVGHTKKMHENGIFYINEELGFYCKPCKIYLADDIEDHVEEENHTEWISDIEDLVDDEYVSTERYLTELSCKFVFCEVCNCNISCSYRCIHQHINGSNHRLRLCEKLEPLNGILPVEDDNEEMWCKICDEYVNNCVEEILDHIDNGVKHSQWFEEIDNLIDDENISIEKYLSDVAFGFAICNKCNVNVPCSWHNLNEHINGYKHSS